MSTQSYYKDRLGFDPREALYESSGGSATGGHQSSSTTIKTGSRTSRIVQHHHYSSSSSAHRSNGGANNNNDYQEYSRPSKKLKHSAQYSSTTVMGTGAYVSGDSSGANISANIAAINNNSNNEGDGYEDALTQFKGTMSIWNYFVENWDFTGTMQYTNIVA